MFGPRRVLQSRLRYAAAQSRPTSYSISPAVRHASTTAAKELTPQASRWPRRLLYAGIFGGFGVAVGKWMDEKVAAPALPGSEEDNSRLSEIRRLYEHEIPIVKELRSDPNYEEADVYGNYSDDDKMQRLTSGPLRGSRGFALQKVFWNDKDKKAVNVVYLGSGTEGWPTVVHGGAIATLVDEQLARIAITNLPARTAVTANLNINYRAPVYSGNFYSFHATLDQERSTDRKAYVVGEVRDPVGRIVVQASALFVVPKGYKLRTVGNRY